MYEVGKKRKRLGRSGSHLADSSEWGGGRTVGSLQLSARYPPIGDQTTLLNRNGATLHFIGGEDVGPLRNKHCLRTVWSAGIAGTTAQPCTTC